MFVLFFLFVGNSGVTVEAAGKTPDDAINWAASYLGQSLEGDNYYGENNICAYQCVDYIICYYKYLGVAPSSGNGCDYATNVLPSGWARVKGGIPQKGDILVYSANDENPAGHVAIFDSEYSTYHQNFNNCKRVTHETYRYDALNNPYWGYIRPNWDNKPVIGTPLDLGSVFDATLTDASGRSICCRSDGKLQMGTYTYDERSKYVWNFEKQSDGSYRITSWSGNCMDCAGGGTVNGTAIQAYSWNGTAAQKYYIYDAGNGKIVLEPACAPGSVIDQGGTNSCIHLWEYTANNANQMFTLQISAKANLASSFNAKIMIYNTDSKKTALYEDSNGDIVHKKWEELDTNDKWRYVWHFEKNADGSYSIKSMYDNKGFDCNNWGTDNGTNITTFGYYGSSAQNWNIYNVSGGRYVLEPQCAPGRVADAGGTNGSLHLWEYTDNNANQRFLFVSDESTELQVEGPDSLDLSFDAYQSVEKLCTIGGKTDNIIYESLNEDIVVIEDGYIKPVNHGEAIIRATYKNDKTKYKDISCSIKSLYFYEQYGRGLLTMDCKDARIVEYDVVAGNNDVGNKLTVTTMVISNGKTIKKEQVFDVSASKRNAFFVVVDRKDFANSNNDYTTSAELKDKLPV